MIVVVGCISDASFQRCCNMVKVLKDAGLSVKVPELPLFETQWEEYLQEKKTQVGGNIFEVNAILVRTFIRRPQQSFRWYAFNLARDCLFVLYKEVHSGCSRPPKPTVCLTTLVDFDPFRRFSAGMQTYSFL